MLKPIAIIASLVLCTAGPGAKAHHTYQLGKITIGHPYARATVPGQSVGGGFLVLDNQGSDDQLLSVSATVSHTVELHRMTMQGDVMRMRHIDAIALPSGKRVELKPSDQHIMFLGLKAPLKAGESFLMTLRFTKAGEVTVKVTVEAP